MYEIEASNQFLKDLKLLRKRSLKDAELLLKIIDTLAQKGHKGLSIKHKPHKLSGKYKDFWECHIKPDLLLIWSENDVLWLIELVRTGTHSDLF